MTNEEKIAFLQGIMTKDGSDLTAEDRQTIRTLANEYGVKIPRRSCGQCHQDAAVIIYTAVRARMDIEGENDMRKYRLKPGIDVLFNWERVNDATCTDERAARWIAEGLPTDYFERYETDVQIQDVPAD